MEAFKHKEDFKMPEKPSAGIRVAVHDLILCEQNPNYKIDMGCWHAPHSIGTGKTICAVCLGGSILARKEDNHEYALGDAVDELDPKILAMDCFRNGFIYMGIKKYSYDNTPFPTDISYQITAISDSLGEWFSYREDAQKFKKKLLLLADKLEEIGY